MNSVHKLWRYGALVRHNTGKSLVRQAMEILRLRFGPSRIGLTEYFELEIFDDRVYGWAERRRCIGHRGSSRIQRDLNVYYWHGVAHDKILNYLVLTHLGFPIPESIATFNPFGRRIDKEPQLSSPDEVSAFLGHHRPFPLFAKPVHGYSGVAAYGVRDMDLASGSIELINGETMSLDALTRDMVFEPYGGMLFQRLVRPSPAVAEVFGDRLSSFRIIVLLTASGPRIHMTFWKIARLRNMLDNFSHGKYGNMLGWINRDTGVLERVIGGFWPESDGIAVHPDTGQGMIGFTIPEWETIRTMCLSAAVHFPGLRIQSWDVALSDRGPVILELNTGADLEVPQLVGRTPFLDDTLQSLLAG
jgi:Sugar-transfer associated ATP-grasp